MGIIIKLINHYKDPYQPTSIMESRRFCGSSFHLRYLMLFAASVEESGSNEIHPRNVHTTDVDRLDHLQRRESF